MTAPPCVRRYGISLPHPPTITILFLMEIGTIMKAHLQMMFWRVTGNNPMVLEVTDVIDTLSNALAAGPVKFGMTSAVGFTSPACRSCWCCLQTTR